MIDLAKWEAEEKAFRDYVSREAKRVGHYPPAKNRLLNEICAHYELESDEFETADQKARRIFDQELNRK